MELEMNALSQSCRMITTFQMVWQSSPVPILNSQLSNLTQTEAAIVETQTGTALRSRGKSWELLGRLARQTKEHTNLQPLVGDLKRSRERLESFWVSWMDSESSGSDGLGQLGNIVVAQNEQCAYLLKNWPAFRLAYDQENDPSSAANKKRRHASTLEGRRRLYSWCSAHVEGKNMSDSGVYSWDVPGAQVEEMYQKMQTFYK